MSSHLITDRPQERPPAGDVEQSPSLMSTDDPTFARLVGFIGALLVTFAGTVLLLYRFRFETTWVSPVSAYMLLLLGLACLLFHAAFDNDVQFRRVYVFFAG